MDLVRVRCRVCALLSSYVSVGQWREGMSIRCIVGQWRVHQGTVCPIYRPFGEKGPGQRIHQAFGVYDPSKMTFLRESLLIQLRTSVPRHWPPASCVIYCFMDPTSTTNKMNNALCTLAPWTCFRVTFQSHLTWNQQGSAIGLLKIFFAAQLCELTSFSQHFVCFHHIRNWKKMSGSSHGN